ncbi:hypothetical protein OG948_33630 [Embleya sp. NBC_00888]|uniref:hypothetical protein n=1 Tax=Embleya sp. NBC_00888 TaxID=2975960 RepID=UPI0038677536|nr:hypothetical protein OG948_33630 [Embleya sp. NBC_00888]
MSSKVSVPARSPRWLDAGVARGARGAGWVEGHEVHEVLHEGVEGAGSVKNQVRELAGGRHV